MITFCLKIDTSFTLAEGGDESSRNTSLRTSFSHLFKAGLSRFAEIRNRMTDKGLEDEAILKRNTYVDLLESLCRIHYVRALKRNNIFWHSLKTLSLVSSPLPDSWPHETIEADKENL